MILLTSDWHLDDQPENEYRWHVFDEIEHVKDIELIIVAGDVANFKDRHTGTFVNRLVMELRRLKLPVVILRGNHDTPLTGVPYWEFLNNVPDLEFISKPIARGAQLFLPHEHDPAQAWAGIDFSLYDVIFMHQSADGADIGHGRRYKSRKGAVPMTVHKQLKIYSGDIHIPQEIGKITYIGAPHHVKYGDDHRCRMLVLNSTYDVEREIVLRPADKMIVEITSVADLQTVKAAKGDQVRLTMTLPAGQINTWQNRRVEIAAWARDKGVTLTSVEPVVMLTGTGQGIDSAIADQDEEVMRQFAESVGLDDALLTTGLDLIHEAKGAVQ